MTTGIEQKSQYILSWSLYQQAHTTHTISHRKYHLFCIHGSSGQRNNSIEKIILFQLCLFWKKSSHLQIFLNAWNWVRRIHTHTQTHVFPLNPITILLPIYAWRNRYRERLCNCLPARELVSDKLRKSLSRVHLFVTLWTVAHQAPLSMRCPRQEYWSGVPFPFSGDLPDSGIEPGSPALQAGIVFTVWATSDKAEIKFRVLDL